ncbi:MAG: metal-dependent hydrolase [Anaerolineaceae bacterium 4572_78]|nr:MAG: metal-dependent hydrolase [Anaerolineaceae bacterium 4572_78]
MAIKYTYVGHNTHLLDIDGKKVVIDPFFNDNPATDVSANSVEADFILVSHGHYDHIADAVLIAKRTEAKVISNFEIIAWLDKQGVPQEQLHAQHIGGGFTHDIGYVKLTIAHHGSMLPDGSNGGNPTGFLIKTNDKTLYFACDTALFSDMKLYANADLAVLPIGDNFTMGPNDAVQAVKFCTPKVVVPCHYNTWAPIKQNAEAWKEKVEAVTDTKVENLKPGQSLTI